jgi:hypothetical protein
MVTPELEALVRDAWKAVAIEMGDNFLNMSWLSAPAQATARALVEEESLPLAA